MPSKKVFEVGARRVQSYLLRYDWSPMLIANPRNGGCSSHLRMADVTAWGNHVESERHSRRAEHIHEPKGPYRLTGPRV